MPITKKKAEIIARRIAVRAIQRILNTSEISDFAEVFEVAAPDADKIVTALVTLREDLDPGDAP